MSINELDYRKTNLSQEQVQQAESAIYGLSQTSQPAGAVDPKTMTAEQAEFLRNVLLQYDSGHGQINEFDLNKPPQKPYKYQEYPRMIYHHERRKYMIVQNRDQLDMQLARGFQLDPYPMEVDNSPVLDMTTVAEARAMDEKLKGASARIGSAASQQEAFAALFSKEQQQGE